jgi:hypothetical protein
MREFWSLAKVSLARCCGYNKVWKTGKDDDGDKLPTGVEQDLVRSGRSGPRPSILSYCLGREFYGGTSPDSAGVDSSVLTGLP